MNSDSESDDELLRAPTFIKKTRTVNKEERDQFDFLDKTMKKESERLMRTQRIAEKRKQEEDRFLKEVPLCASLSSGAKNDVFSSDNGETASVVSKSPSTDAPTQGNVKKSSKYDDNDPLYWSRIDDIEKNAEDNRLRRDKRQREMHQYVNGYNSEEGYDSSSDRKVDMATMDATIAGASSILGTRLIFFSEARRGVELTAFPSLNRNVNEVDAHQSLQDILIEMERKAPPTSNIWTRSQKFFIENYKRNFDYGLLIYYLEGHSRTCKKSAPLIIPDKLMSWLVTTSCCCAHYYLQSSALTAAISCLENDVKIARWPDTMDAYDIGKPLFRLKDFVPFFQAAFGLWTAIKAPSRMFIMSRTMGLHTDDVSMSSRINAAMKLWMLAFEKDLIFVESDFATTNEFEELHDIPINGDTFEPFVSCLVSVARLGIDSCFHVGANLEMTRMRLLNSYFYWLARKHSTSKESRIVDLIIKHAATEVVKACSGLSDSSYNDKIDDGDDDSNGWLSISLVVRSFQSPLSQKSDLLIKFYAHLAVAAIRKCFYEKSHWDADILEVASEVMVTASVDSISAVTLPFLCLAFSYVAMGTMLDTPSITNDGPRYHCVVELSAICSQVGITLLQRRFDTADSSTPTKVYENCNEADCLEHHFFEPMENLCEVHKKKITSVISSPHLRRCKELIVMLCSFYRALKDDASFFSRREGSCRKQKIQTEINCHYMKKE